MGAALRMQCATPRTEARQGAGSGDGRKPASGPKNRLADQNLSTARDGGRSLLTEADILAAIAWRLDGIPIEEVESITAALRPLADDFREARQEVAALLADLRRPGDRRDAWGLACAVLAREALSRGDVLGFALAGFEVVAAARQGRRSPRVRSPLTNPMREFAQANPLASEADAFTAFTDGACDAVTGYDGYADALIVRGWSVVTRDTFERQYRRLRST